MIYSVVMFGPWWRVMDGTTAFAPSAQPATRPTPGSKTNRRQRGEIMKRKPDNGGAVHALTATELVDLVRSAIPRDDAIDLVALNFVAVVAAGAALEATRETYARVDQVLAKRNRRNKHEPTAAVSKISDGAAATRQHVIGQFGAVLPEAYIPVERFGRVVLTAVQTTTRIC